VLNSRELRLSLFEHCPQRSRGLLAAGCRYGVSQMANMALQIAGTVGQSRHHYTFSVNGQRP